MTSRPHSNLLLLLFQKTRVIPANAGTATLAMKALGSLTAIPSEKCHPRECGDRVAYRECHWKLHSQKYLFPVHEQQQQPLGCQKPDPENHIPPVLT